MLEKHVFENLISKQNVHVMLRVVLLANIVLFMC